MSTIKALFKASRNTIQSYVGKKVYLEPFIIGTVREANKKARFDTEMVVETIGDFPPVEFTLYLRNDYVELKVT